MAAAAILDFSNFKFLTVARLTNAELCRHAKFGRNRSKRGRDMAIFSIFQDGGRRHLGFLKFQIFNGRNAQESRTASPCQIWSKSVEPLPRTVAEIWRFFIFQDGGRRHLGLLKFETFNGRTAQDGRSASPRKIWSKSVKLLARYRDF